MEEVEVERRLSPNLEVEPEVEPLPEQESLGIGAMLWGRNEVEDEPGKLSTMLWSHESKLKEHEETLCRHDEALEGKSANPEPPQPEPEPEPEEDQPSNVSFSQYM